MPGSFGVANECALTRNTGSCRGAERKPDQKRYHAADVPSATEDMSGYTARDARRTVLRLHPDVASRITTTNCNAPGKLWGVIRPKTLKFKTPAKVGLLSAFCCGEFSLCSVQHLASSLAFLRRQQYGRSAAWSRS